MASARADDAPPGVRAKAGAEAVRKRIIGRDLNDSATLVAAV
jgi:hypothetical protein